MGRSSSEIDREGIERTYRLGVLTVTQIAKQFNTDRTSINRRAKREGWTRDLSKQVKLGTRAKVSEAIVEKAHEKLKESSQANAQAVDGGSL